MRKLTLGLICISAIGIGALQSGSRSAPSAPKAQGPSRNPAQVTSTETPHLYPREGAWRFQFERKVEISNVQTSWFTLDLQGEYLLIRSSPSEIRLQIRLKGTAETRPEFAIALSPEGQIGDLRMLGSLQDSEHEKHWAQLGRDVVLNHFIFSERSLLGATRVQSSWKDENTFEKWILSYPGHSELSIGRSRHQARFVSKELEETRGEEVLTLSSGDLRQTSSYRHRRLGKLSLAPRLSESLASKEIGWTESAEWPGAQEQISQALPLPPLTGVSGWDSRQRLQAFRAYVRALDRQDARGLSALHKLLGNRSDVRSWTFAVGTLASSVNPQAQKELTHLWRTQRLTPDEMRTVLAALTTAPIPLEAETEKVVRATAQSAASDLQEAALYTLGSAIRTAESSEQRERLETDLETALQKPLSRAESLVALDAIGNSGSARFLPFIQTMAKSEQERVRLKAVHAMRFMDPEKTRPLLDSLASEESPAMQKMVKLTQEFQLRSAPESGDHPVAPETNPSL